jgi:hypothetical protein
LFAVAVQLSVATARRTASKLEAVQAIAKELDAMAQRKGLAALAQSMEHHERSAAAVQQLLDMGHGVAVLLTTAQRSSFARSVLPDAFGAFGFEPDHGAQRTSAAQRYAEAEAQWFEPFDNAHPHLLKNVVLNDIGLNNFPTADLSGLVRQTLGVSMRLSAIRLFIVGRAALARERFGVDDYIVVVTAFSRWVEKDRRFKSTPFFTEGSC